MTIMNSAVIQTIQRFQRLMPHRNGWVLDVGSQNINCRWSGRDLWKPPIGPDCWGYTGLDIARGANVDIVVSEGPFCVDSRYEVVMSAGCLEHTKRPWQVFRSMAAHLKPGGWLYALVPWVCPYHAYPIDAWRISPDGWRVLCEDNGLEVVETFLWADALHREKTLVGLVLNAWMRMRHGCRPKESVLYARKHAC